MNWPGWSVLSSGVDYGLYVWAAYVVALLVVLSEIVVLRFSRRSILEHLGRYALGHGKARLRGRRVAR